MELVSGQVVTRKEGRETVVLTAGQHYKIESSPDGAEHLDYVAPASGATITTLVQIQENGD